MIDTGDVVRIQPNHISFTTIEAMKDIHGFKAIPAKGDVYRNLLQPPGTTVGENLLTSTYASFREDRLICSDRQYHDKFRRIFGPELTNTELMKLETSIQTHVDTVVRLVCTGLHQGPVNITLLSKYFAMDVTLLSHCLLT